ncbi:sensor histidine kinase [Streptomyces sp. t39]|uniref:sensor histidine kinase n=1 Tax=Streptomyces sp. t39 TaxID=1828156 RepID=UPI0011CD814E|nr:sensor histidine kinase [Streptomyces sp. t39]TXS57945.1 sensor histidine kinase [Streptomyces sp. t39]
MSATEHPPASQGAPAGRSWRNAPPWVWTVLAWCAGLVFTFLVRVRLPGEDEPPVMAGVLIYRWDGITQLAIATALTVAGARRLDRSPLGGLGLLLAASVVATSSLSVGEIPLAQFLAVDVALYTVAASRPRRTGAVAVALALGVLAGYLTLRWLAGWGTGTSAELAVALTAVVAWLTGDSAHRSRLHAEQLRERSTAQAVTDERLRIARELHDMVAHSIGIVALQAGAARRVIDTQPERAREALGEVEATSRETLAGLRRMLGALREADRAAAAGRETVSGTPGLGEAVSGMPGLGEVDRLAAATTAAGVRVEVLRVGERRPLPQEIDLSAYRIVQEAVTNVVRHAGTAACRVTLHHRDDALSIEVVDDGRGGAPSDTGYGLLGMRERVGLLHGEFSAGPRPEGGFRVRARLPLPAAAR